MTRLEKLIQDLAEAPTTIEAVGCLHGLEAAALIWCKRNCPEEVVGKDVSIYGMVNYLDDIVE